MTRDRTIRSMATADMSPPDRATTYLRNAEAEQAHRAREVYHSLTVPLDQSIIIRVDGRSFSKVTKDCTKPFDVGFDASMRNVLMALVKDFGAVYGHTHSDEASILLPAASDLFGRSMEKLVSVSAGLASAAYVCMLGEFELSTPMGLAHFDSRLWVGPASEVPGYFAWRQADARRNALNTAAYWALRSQGMSGAAVHPRLSGASAAAKREIVATSGTTFEDLPAWTRNGVGVWWGTVMKDGYNPLTKHTVTVPRRLLQVVSDLPTGAEYEVLVAMKRDGEVAW